MKKQQGAALVVVLVLLAISLMLGLSGMQASLVGERLAGNYRAATLAQMAAEANAEFGIRVLGDRAFEKNAFNLKVSDLTFPDWNENRAEDSLWVVCDTTDEGCDSGYGAYALVELVDSDAAPDGYYVVGMGAVRDGAGKVVAESLPVFVNIRNKFAFKYALTVLGGIENINGKGWLPDSNKALFSKGKWHGSAEDPISPEAVYYEDYWREPHACEEEGDPQACYKATRKFHGEVIRAETGDYTASKRLEEIYYKINNPLYNVVGKVGTINLERRDDEQCEKTSQLVFVETIDRVKGGEMFCGVLIVWGGGLDQDTETSGSPSLKGMVIMANYDSQDGEPNFERQGKVSMNIKGGGSGAIMEFDRDLIKAAFANAGIIVDLDDDYVDELLGEKPSSNLSGVVASWR